MNCNAMWETCGKNLPYLPITRDVSASKVYWQLQNGVNKCVLRISTGNTYMCEDILTGNSTSPIRNYGNVKNRFMYKYGENSIKD